jgi:hypothetical protein
MHNNDKDSLAGGLDNALRVVQGELVNEDEEGARKRLEGLAWLFDNSIPIPGLKIRVGLDAIVGLVPGIGDLISAGVSMYLMSEASKLGVSRAILIRMAGNVMIDTIIGAIPFVGDLFDIGWKANTRNVRLLVEHLDQPRKVTYTSWLVIAVFFVILAVIITGLGFAIAFAISAIRNMQR